MSRQNARAAPSHRSRAGAAGSRPFALDPRPLKHGSKGSMSRLKRRAAIRPNFSFYGGVPWHAWHWHRHWHRYRHRHRYRWWYRHRHRSVVFTGISLRFRAGCTPVVGLRVRVIHGKDNLCDPSQDNLCDPTVSKPLGHTSHNARTHLDCHWCRERLSRLSAVEVPPNRANPQSRLCCSLACKCLAARPGCKGRSWCRCGSTLAIPHTRQQ